MADQGGVGIWGGGWEGDLWGSLKPRSESSCVVLKMLGRLILFKSFLLSTFFIPYSQILEPTLFFFFFFFFFF